MTTRTVAGTAIQAAIDASAATGDTVKVDAGGYAGFTIPAGKNVLVIASGSPPVINGPGNTVTVRGAGSTIRGFEVVGSTGQFNSLIFVNASDVTLDDMNLHDGECFGVRFYGAGLQRLKMKAPIFHHVACAIEFNRAGANSVISDPIVHDTDRMIVNDTTPGNDTGGNGFNFYKMAGPVLIERPIMDRIYSLARLGKPASYDYGIDGGCFELYGGSTGVTVIGGEIRSTVIVMESGKGTTDPDNANFTMDGTKVWGYGPGLAADSTKAAIGFLFRSLIGANIRNCQFRDLDWHTLLLESTGNFPGKVDGIRFENNEVWLKQGTRLVTIGAGVPLTATTLTTSGNKIHPNGSTEIASVLGKGKTATLATYQSWAPAGATWEAGSTWSDVIVPPPPPPPPVETPLEIAIRERDAARALATQAAAALAIANASLATANTALAASDAAVVSLTAQRDAALAGQSVSEAARIAAVIAQNLAVIAKADAEADAAKVRAAVDVAAAV